MRPLLLTLMVTLLAAPLLTGCATKLGVADEASDEQAAQLARDYTGEVDVYLLPYDEQGVCSIEIGLRNTSGVRQREARLQLVWFDHDGQLLDDQSLRMDGLLPGRDTAKNLSLPVRCERVSQLDMKSAEWTLFQGWDNPLDVVVPIAGAHRTAWQFRWDAALGAFVGEGTARNQGRSD